MSTLVNVVHEDHGKTVYRLILRFDRHYGLPVLETFSSDGFS